jgi:ferredoxin
MAGRSARLTHGLRRATGQRLLRFSVLRETSMTSAISIQFQKAKMLHKKATIDAKNCLGCGDCIFICSNKAIVEPVNIHRFSGPRLLEQ